MSCCEDPNHHTNRWTTSAGERVETQTVDGKQVQVLVSYVTDHVQESCSNCGWTGSDSTSDRKQ